MVLGFALLMTALILPCGPSADYAGASLPYQDPTPELLDRQAAEIAAIKHELVARFRVSALVALVGFAAIGYATWTWRRRRRRGGTGISRQPGGPA
jgi:hypothetical protein